MLDEHVPQTHVTAPHIGRSLSFRQRVVGITRAFHRTALEHFAKGTKRLRRGEHTDHEIVLDHEDAVVPLRFHLECDECQFIEWTAHEDVRGHRIRHAEHSRAGAPKGLCNGNVVQADNAREATIAFDHQVSNIVEAHPLLGVVESEGRIDNARCGCHELPDGPGD